MNIRFDRLFWLASIALFIISLALPAFSQVRGQQSDPGIWVLALGWLGLTAAPYSIANLAWLANLMLISSWVFSRERKPRPALIASLFAVAFAALPGLTGQVATDEAGFPRPIAAFGSGYIVWIGAMLAALAAACLMLRGPNEAA